MQHVIAVVFMMIAGGLGLSALQPKIVAMLRAPQERAAGVQLQRIAVAAGLHMTNNFQSLLTATSGGGIDVAPAALPVTGLIGAINAYGQTTTLKITQPAANTLVGLVLTCGGAEIGDTSALRAADAASAALGASGAQTVLPDPGAILSYEPTRLTVPQATDAYDLTAFGFGGCQPAPGHLAALLVIDNGQATPPFVHRYSQGADREPNTMHTTLYMAANEIRDVKDVRLSDGRWLSNAFETKSVVQDGATVAKPTCPAGSAPDIYVDPVIFGDEGIGNPLVTVQAYAENDPAPANSWTVRMRVYTLRNDGTGTREVPPGPHAQAKIEVRCK